MPDTILVTGYALKEGHGHYYFNAVVEATDDDCKESISARAYAELRKLATAGRG